MTSIVEKSLRKLKREGSVWFCEGQVLNGQETGESVDGKVVVLTE